MPLIVSNSRGTDLKMAHLVTPSPSSHGADMIDLTADDDDLATDVIAKNRVVIRKYESFGFYSSPPSAYWNIPECVASGSPACC